jgi:hypothetical protein
VQLLPDIDDRVLVRRALQRGFAEVSGALEKQQSDSNFDAGVAWYRRDLAKMEDVTQKIFPETKDPVKMGLFKTLLAALSGGMDPKMNYQVACEAFAQYLRTGQVPDKSEKRIGETGIPKFLGRNAQSSAATLNMLLGKTGGEAQLVDYLTTVHEKTLRGLKQAYGALDLGPKFGRFLLNLTGHANEVTIDLWASRTWNRWMGTPFRKVAKEYEMPDTPTSVSEHNAMIESFQAIANKISEKTGQSLSAMDAQAVLWYYEKSLYGSERESFSKGAESYAEHPVHELGPKAPKEKAQEELMLNAVKEKTPGAFSPDVFGFVGRLDDLGELTVRAGKLDKISHGQLESSSGIFPAGSLSFRFNTKTRTVYWWFGMPDGVQREVVDAYFAKKGYDVRAHKPIIGGDVGTTGRTQNYEEAHGRELEQPRRMEGFSEPPSAAARIAARQRAGRRHVRSLGRQLFGEGQ